MGATQKSGNVTFLLEGLCIVDEKITLERVKAACETAAKIVAVYGEKYLPIFQRLEEEYSNLLEHEKALERAKRLAYKSMDRHVMSGTQNGTHVGTQTD